MNSARRLQDAELATAVLDIIDPMGVKRLSLERPNQDLEPVILGEYHLPTSDQPIWCCHCQARRPWNGFIIENETGIRYLIGSHCGPKHYELSFALARRQHGELKQRRGLLDRLRAALDAQTDLGRTIATVLHSGGLRKIDDLQKRLKAEWGDAFFRLQALAINGSPLTTAVRVRDHAAEGRRAASDNSPIYTFENQSLGPLEGSAIFISHGDCRDRLLALRAALAAAARASQSGTDTLSTSALTRIVKEVETAHASAQIAIGAARGAHAFFSSAHLAKLRRWSEQYDGFDIREIEDGVAFVPQSGKLSEVTRIGNLDLQDLPTIRPA